MQYINIAIHLHARNAPQDGNLPDSETDHSLILPITRIVLALMWMFVPDSNEMEDRDDGMWAWFRPSTAEFYFKAGQAKEVANESSGLFHMEQTYDVWKVVPSRGWAYLFTVIMNDMNVLPE